MPIYTEKSAANAADFVYSLNAAQCAASDFAKRHFFRKGWYNAMASYIAPEVKERFNSLSPELRNCILDRNVELRTVHDLIRVLEDIVNEGER